MTTVRLQDGRPAFHGPGYDHAVTAESVAAYMQQGCPDCRRSWGVCFAYGCTAPLSDEASRRLARNISRMSP